MKIFEQTAEGAGYFRVYKDGNEISKHLQEREAIERAQEAKFSEPDSTVFYKHDYEVEVALTTAGLTLAGTTQQPVDLPPVITSTPNPSFSQGISGQYDMKQNYTDDGLSSVSHALTNTLPNGLSFSSSTGILSYDGIGPLSVSQHQLAVTDSTGAVFSPSFDISINSAETLRAFPGAQGFGTETTHGRGGVVVQVTNLNSTGPGSLREALLMTVPRIVVFRVAGTISLADRITMESANSNCYVAGQTAPGDGICLRMSGVFGPPVRTRSGARDIVFQHIRFRHGCPTGYDSAVSDNFTIQGDSSYIVLDHCSFTWGNDEAFSLHADNMNNITVSWCIAGEGVFLTGGEGGNNMGPLYSGTDVYNISTHHNLFIHHSYRSPRYQTTGLVGQFTGCKQSNNVHYNANNQITSIAMNFYLSTQVPQYVDVINDYYKAGPDGPNSKPFTLNKDSAGTWPDASIHFEGSTWRNVDGTPHALNDEANNYNLSGPMRVQVGGFGSINYTTRSTPLADATNAVTVTSAEQAYQDVVVSKGAGATKPAIDSVDLRLLNAPENGDAWDSANIPSPHGSASYPTLADTGAPTDTSGNGLPDYYQVGVLGKAVGDTYNPANTFTVGNGYSDIENWIHSL